MLQKLHTEPTYTAAAHYRTGGEGTAWVLMATATALNMSNYRQALVVPGAV